MMTTRHYFAALDKASSLSAICRYLCFGILELVRQAIYSDAKAVRSAIKDAIKAISLFKGGEPDRNTLDVLNEALFLVR